MSKKIGSDQYGGKAKWSSSLKGSLIEPLESRAYLSSALALEVDAPADVGSAYFAPAASTSVTLTRADRRRLQIALAEGDLRQSLNRILRNAGVAAFDATLLHYMQCRRNAVYFYNGRQMRNNVAFIEQYLEPRIAQMQTFADAILAHRFPAQVNSQSYTIQLGGQIEWHVQPKKVSDPNFLHVLNRHTYWTDLAMGYQLTGDGRYVRELVAQLQSWSAQTPKISDPNDWIASGSRWWLLDAADRVRNWVDAYFMVLGSPDWTPQANTLFLLRLLDHGEFLSAVAPSGLDKNRTALHASGLARLGMMFPEFAAAATWESQGIALLFRTTAAQFRSDGGHVEQSPAYHLSALNANVETYRLAELNGRSYWTRNRRRFLVKTIDALYQLLTIKGDLPGLSDTYRSSNPRPFLTRCGLLLGETRWLMSKATVDDVLFLGTRRLGGPNLEYEGSPRGRAPISALPESGYYVLRGAFTGGVDEETKKSSNQVVIDVGPKGAAHGHFDLFNVELHGILTDPYIPDPGPYIYDDSADRQYVVSTLAHNTISIDGRNHEAIEEVNSPKIVIDEVRFDDEEARFTAHHYAYDYLPGSPTVARTVWLDRRNPNDSHVKMLVIDWVRSSASHTYTTSFNMFQVPLTAGVVQTAPGVVEGSLSQLHSVRVQSLPVVGQSHALHETFVTSNPAPDAKEDARRFTISQTGTSAVFVTLISDYYVGRASVGPPPTAEFVEPPQPGQPVRVRLIYPDQSTRLLTFTPPDLTPLV